MITEYLKKGRTLVQWLVPFALAVVLLFGCTSNGSPTTETGQVIAEAGQTAAETGQTAQDAEAPLSVEEDGTYTGKDEVALYLHTYKKLPDNFITKKRFPIRTDASGMSATLILTAVTEERSGLFIQMTD